MNTTQNPGSGIGESSSRAIFIAEIGPNHNGDIDLAIEMIGQIAAAGADAVKFQTFSSASTVVAHDAPLADYMSKQGAWENQNKLLEDIRLDFKQFEILADTCRNYGIEFLSTPFDEESVSVLINLGVSQLKVPSGELTNPFLLEAVAGAQIPLIISTGMANLEEIALALETVRCAWLSSGYREKSGDIILLHCTSAYPTAIEDANLKVMDTLSDRFELPVGFSDHTVGLQAPLAAIARGAVLVEKHVTMDRNMPGPDHAASLPLSDIPELIAGIRAVELSLGHGAKTPVAAEIEVAKVARRSLAARIDVRRGDVFNTTNLTALRPASGINPMRRDDLIGRTAKSSYPAGTLIAENELEF